MPLNRAAKSFHKELNTICQAVWDQHPESQQRYEERGQTSTSKEFVSTTMEFQDISIDHGKDLLEGRIVLERLFEPIKAWKSLCNLSIGCDKLIENACIFTC